MSHPEQIQFVEKVKNRFPNYFQNKSILEVGSLNINGTVRIFFEQCFYIGIDVGPGPGVDIVCEGQKFSAAENTFDTVISCECFEHNPHWVDTFSNMHRLCKSDGLIIMSCATTGRKEHGTARTEPASSPLTINLGWDYYKNLTEQDFLANFDLKKMFSMYEFTTNPKSHDLYFWGLKHA